MEIITLILKTEQTERLYEKQILDVGVVGDVRLLFINRMGG